MPGSSERDAIRALTRLFGGHAAKRAVRVGIGDDAAVLEPGGERLVWTVDATVEGVHFRRELLSPEDMGARPVAALSSIVRPAWMADSAFFALARGQADAARELGCPIVGGNLSRGGELGVTTTVLGRAREPILRSGARAGDEMWLLGDV